MPTTDATVEWRKPYDDTFVMRVWPHLWAAGAFGGVGYAVLVPLFEGASVAALFESFVGLAFAVFAWATRQIGLYVSDRGVKVVYSIVRRTYAWTDIESVSVVKSYQFGIPKALKRYDVLADHHPVLHMVDGRDVDIRLSTFLNMVIDQEGLSDIIEAIEGHLLGSRGGSTAQ